MLSKKEIKLKFGVLCLCILHSFPVGDFSSNFKFLKDCYFKSGFNSSKFCSKLLKTSEIFDSGSAVCGKFLILIIFIDFVKFMRKLVKFMRKGGKDINGKGCMKDKDGRLEVSEKIEENYGRIIWKRS